mmetsp:Transcript_13371/g.36974  ORF Transcript_13371/g.36974 Transcript_13371/m.36974 type:complete len:83 (-) Transcript_13371:33-281(-)
MHKVASAADLGKNRVQNGDKRFIGCHIFNQLDRCVQTMLSKYSPRGNNKIFASWLKLGLSMWLHSTTAKGLNLRTTSQSSRR